MQVQINRDSEAIKTNRMKVFMSVYFGKFKRTKFENMADAIAFVRKQKLPSTRLRLNLLGSTEEWDNF